MCYARRKIEGGVGALRESDDTNFLKPNGQSTNLNIYSLLLGEAFRVYNWKHVDHQNHSCQQSSHLMGSTIPI